jgi:hypothetical protein
MEHISSHWMKNQTNISQMYLVQIQKLVMYPVAAGQKIEAAYTYKNFKHQHQGQS